MKKVWMLFAVLIVCVGCNGGAKVDEQVQDLGRAAAPPPAADPHAGMDRSAAPPPGAGPVLKGTVIETINVTEYTYVNFQAADGIKMWAAVSRTDIAKGAAVEIQESMRMKNFTGREAGRTFEEIIFGNLVKQDASGAAPAAAPSAAPAAAPSAAPAAAPAAPSAPAAK